MWDGENRKDIFDFYAPWALATCTGPCAVDGVACVLHMGSRKTAGAWARGAQGLWPVTPEHPLHEVRHWAAAVA
eukprot:2983691-Pyramimonas_sp.AAC.1